MPISDASVIPPLDVERLVAPLEGSIVRMAPLAPEHEDPMYAATRHPEIWTWWPIDPSASRQEFGEWFALWRAETERREAIRFATLDRATGLPLGGTSFLRITPEHRMVEIGWTWLTPAAWNTGANAETKLLMMRQAFEVAGIHRVQFMTDARNERSRRALLALPSHFEGVARDDRILLDGSRRSSAVYSVIDSEWPAVRAALEERVARKAAAR